jgi:hypothetical protein
VRFITLGELHGYAQGNKFESKLGYLYTFCGTKVDPIALLNLDSLFNTAVMVFDINGFPHGYSLADKDAT